MFSSLKTLRPCLVNFFHHSSLITQFSSLITHHSKIPQFLKTLFGGLFGWNILVNFSIQTLTFMSLTGSHKNQYVDQVYRMITSLPALSLSPLHTLSTTKHCPKLQKPKMKHFGWKIPQFLSSDIANSFPLSLPLSNTSNPPITLEHSIDPLRFLSPFVAQTHFLIHQLKSENSGNLSP